MALLGGAVISLVLLTSLGGTSYAWTSPVIVSLGIATLALGTAWLVLARHAADPVIPLRLFRNQTFRIACAISLITGIGMSGAISHLPTSLQIVTGVSATSSGPLIAGLLVTSIASGRHIARTGHYKACPIAGRHLPPQACTCWPPWAQEPHIRPQACTCWSCAWGIGLFLQVMVLIVQNTAAPGDLGRGNLIGQLRPADRQQHRSGPDRGTIHPQAGRPARRSPPGFRARPPQRSAGQLHHTAGLTRLPARSGTSSRRHSPMRSRPTTPT